MLVIRYSIQIILFLLFMAFVAVFSRLPAYQVTPENHAIIKMTVKHAGKIIGKCRPVSEEEQAHLPRNMRVREICPRERSMLKVRLKLDDREIYKSEIAPTGLHQDGAASDYKRFIVPAGTYQLSAELNDRADSEDYQYKVRKKMTLTSSQVVVIDFKTEAGGFVIQ